MEKTLEFKRIRPHVYRFLDEAVEIHKSDVVFYTKANVKYNPELAHLEALLNTLKDSITETSFDEFLKTVVVNNIQERITFIEHSAMETISKQKIAAVVMMICAFGTYYYETYLGLILTVGIYYGIFTTRNEAVAFVRNAALYISNWVIRTRNAIRIGLWSVRVSTRPIQSAKRQR